MGIEMIAGAPSSAPTRIADALRRLGTPAGAAALPARTEPATGGGDVTSAAVSPYSADATTLPTGEGMRGTLLDVLA
jgi:hypothetical protein